MLHIAYYEADIPSFCKANAQEILGALAEHHGFALEIQQRFAWQEQIRLMQICLKVIDAGLIFFEPRLSISDSEVSFSLSYMLKAWAGSNDMH